MSVVGVDLGEYKSVVAVARNRGIDIVTNEVSNRFTPSMVGFNGDQRLLGEAAKTQEVMNFKNTITSIKRLIGRDFKEKDVQEIEKKFCLYNLVEDINGGIAAEVQYQGETKRFSMIQLSSMYLTVIKKIAEAALKTAVSDIVLAVPAYYTERQRLALINSAEIAGLNCLRLITEPAAAALVYGITRVADLPETEPRHVVFVDLGHSALTVSVVAFTKEKATVKATAFDRHLGGRQFDEDLVHHFAKEILAKHKLDVTTKPKALLRLRVACEKLKKVLSANSNGVLNVESLTDEVDVHSALTRDQFEDLIKLSLERVEAPLRIALHNAGIRKDQVDFVELIGGSTRIPAIRKIVSEFFNNREGIISTTLNLDEAIARGSAFQCAMISPLFKVRDYNLKDVNLFDIKASWKSEGGDNVSDVLLFKEGEGMPSTKALTFHGLTA
jgi:heat shock protein 4